MSDQGREVEGHVDTGIGLAEQLAIEADAQRQVEAPAVPGLAQFVRGNTDRAKGAGGLGLEEAEALAQLRGYQVAQGNVVDHHQQANPGGGLFRTRPHGDIAGNHRDLALEVDAPGAIGHDNGIAGSEKAVRTALVHQRVGPEALRHLRAASLAHQLHVINVGRAVRPLERPGQRRGAGLLDKGLTGAVLDLLCEALEHGLLLLPVIEGLLQGHSRRQATLQVPGYDDQGAVAALLQ